MFYEEKMIGGILHYRTMPNAPWAPYTMEELSSRYEQLNEQYANVNKRMEKLEALTGELRGHKWRLVEAVEGLLVPDNYEGEEFARFLLAELEGE